jgi:hypothetical protein
VPINFTKLFFITGEIPFMFRDGDHSITIKQTFQVAHILLLCHKRLLALIYNFKKKDFGCIETLESKTL